MSYEREGPRALEYYPYRVGSSRILFRGPRPALKGKYVACMGGTETYGRFVERPWPALTEPSLGKACINLGCLNAGVDAYVKDPVVLQVAEGAAVTVIQIMGAQNISNRFYSVHPRRNDRFLRASKLMQTIYGEVDFTEFHYTRHMLNTLRALSEERFVMVVEEVKSAWVARMQELIGQVRGRVVLVWFADHLPKAPDDHSMERDPLFVDRDMLRALEPGVADYVEYAATDAVKAQGVEGLIYSDFDAPAAVGVMGPLAHTELAQRMAPVLAKYT